MNFVILDLEWNGTYSKKLQSYINEIIEFGAVKVDEQMNITDKFSMIVRPEIGKKLCSSVRTLTNLTTEDVNKGYPFPYAINKFRKFTKDCILMTWSTSDIYALISNSQYHLKTDRLPFVKEYVDLQTYCQDMLGVSEKTLGLSTAAEMLNIDISDIPQHRAVSDSIITAMCFKELYSKPAVISHIQRADCDEFYNQLNFHTTFLSSLENPAVDKSVMFFNCCKCGARTEQTSGWEPKNKAFFAKFSCPVCDNAFTGKIQFKVKYDGVVPVKKVLIPQKQPSETNA